MLLCCIDGPASSNCSSRDLLEVVHGSPKLNTDKASGDNALGQATKLQGLDMNSGAVS